MATTQVGTPVIHAWISARYPRLAEMLDRVKGMADFFADIAEAIDAYAEQHEIDASNFRPEARVLPDGTVVIDLDPQPAGAGESQRWPSDGLPWEIQVADACDRIPAMADVFLEIAGMVDNMGRRHEFDVADLRSEALVTPCGKIVISLDLAYA